MKLLTNLIFEPKGKHDLSLAYAVKDTVMSADGSQVYFALQDVPAGIPLSNAAYWKLQIDLSASKSAMDDFLASFGNYAKEIGTRVKGEATKASGNPVSFLADAGSLLQPVTVLEPKQEGSGDPSPDNVRPFIGFNKLELNHTGKNLLSKVDIVGDIFLKSLVRLKAGETYTLSVQKMPDALYFSNEGGSVDFAMNTGSMSLTYTAETTGGYSVLARYGSGASVGYNMQLEHSSAPGAYAPYQGKTHTVQLGQTVYGFRYDWLTGKGRIEWKGLRLLGKWVSSGMKYVSGYVGAWLNAVINDDYSEGQETILCSHLVGRGVYGWARDGVYVNDGNTIGIQFSGASIPGYTDTGNADQNAGLVSAYLDANDVWVVWKLAAPVEIQFAPAILSAAEPEQTNTLYGDGNIETEYVKPLHVSIEERVAAAVAAAMTE